jgi:tetrahydromethanopterin S-methyltransferase subunit F
MSQFQEWFFGEIVKYSESGLPQKIKKLENDIQTKNELIKRQKRNITDNGLIANLVAALYATIVLLIANLVEAHYVKVT